MSYTLSTSEMVAELQRRIPVGLSPTFCMDRLNEGYRWICQRGPMNWLLTQQWVTTIATVKDVAFPMPVDWDSGKPSYLSGDLTIGYGVEIPYKPYDLAIRHQTYGSNIAFGQYSVWTYRHIGESIKPYPVAPKQWTITCVPKANFIDGETLTITSTSAVIYEFDTNGSVGGGHVAVDISGATTAIEVADVLAAAINAFTAGDVTASVPPTKDGTVNIGASIISPSTITTADTVADAGFTIAASGAIAVGTYDYIMTCATDGQYGYPMFSPQSPKATVAVQGATVGSTEITLRAGPAGTKYRFLWRTKLGAPGIYYLDQTILNNTDAYRVIDTKADASLGALKVTDDPTNWSFVGILLPVSAGSNGHILSFIYHQSTKTPLSVGNNVYFPSPDVFDSAIIELAESEVRRIYNLAGWEVIRTRTQEQVLSIIDGYHTTKQTMAGLADEARQLQESQAVRNK